MTYCIKNGKIYQDENIVTSLVFGNGTENDPYKFYGPDKVVELFQKHIPLFHDDSIIIVTHDRMEWLCYAFHKGDPDTWRLQFINDVSDQKYIAFIGVSIADSNTDVFIYVYKGVEIGTFNIEVCTAS